MGEVPDIGKEAIIFKKVKKCDPGNYKLFRLTLILGKVMEKLISGNHFQTYWGQEGDWEKSAWIYEG